MVEPQPSKLAMPVRSRSPAPLQCAGQGFTPHLRPLCCRGQCLPACDGRAMRTRTQHPQPAPRVPANGFLGGVRLPRGLAAESSRALPHGLRDRSGSARDPSVSHGPVDRRPCPSAVKGEVLLPDRLEAVGLPPAESRHDRATVLLEGPLERADAVGEATFDGWVEHPGLADGAHQMRQMSRLGSYRRRLCPLKRPPSGRVPEVSSALPKPSRIGWAVATLVNSTPSVQVGSRGFTSRWWWTGPGAHQEVEVVTRAHVAPFRDQCGVAPFLSATTDTMSIWRGTPILQVGLVSQA